MIKSFLTFFKKKNKPRKSKAKKYHSNEHVYMPVDSLVVGMYVTELDIPWLESPFTFQGFVIETSKDLQTLIETCQYVYIDTRKQKKISAAVSPKSFHNADMQFKISKPPEKLGSFEKEIDRATQNYHDAGVVVTDFMDKISNGGGIDVSLAKETVSSCVNSVLHSPDAFLWLSQLKNKDQYTAQHSLNVCVLSILLGRQVGMNEQLLNQVGLCGMMHDMGKMLVPGSILNKPGRLDPDELIVMQSHTTLGYELLKSSPNMFPGAIETAHGHHECLNGTGYPKGIKSNALSFYTHIVAIADIYDAITSDRVYQKGRTHLEATKILIDESGGHLKSKLVVKFIESLGIYPPGCFVLLNNGSIALVVEINNQSKLRPKILLLLDEERNPLNEIVIDLSKIMKDAFGKPLSISNIIKPENYQIDSSKYYQQGIIQKGFSTAK